MRVMCWILGHRWLRASIPGVLAPAVVVAWPRVCLRCGCEDGL